ncbi:zinc ribbon domain-containing protein [Dictyobacter arantiisoli]|uniref:zinc ribbon domain-containing protein n=1 Tax=Dictyobacter arantiisoli TaxID=2014874 RepID=UPI00155A087E|nr:zinc ribbon domain-containing protein [Dictyobacter arantiisoli]
MESGSPVLDFIIEVEKEAPPEWDGMGRVLGADWGVHSLLTATAVDETGAQVGRPFFLETGGFDGRQARTRRQIDELKKKVARFEQERDAVSQGHSKRAWYEIRLACYRREVDRCWRKYEQRNRALAHLASNVLLLLCRLHGCQLVSMESLKTLKTTGRGVRGRWRNYRNNATIRGEIWRLLRYKCHLVGLRFQTCPPRGTSHTCPHCGTSARTYRSPDERGETVPWGRWLWCETCSFNGDRDYCASLNIARLGMAYLLHMKHTGKARACSITDPRVKPVSYTGAGSALLLPPTGPTPPDIFGERSVTFLVGWVRLSCNRHCRRRCSCDCMDSCILLRIVTDFSNGSVARRKLISQNSEKRRTRDRLGRAEMLNSS